MLEIAAAFAAELGTGAAHVMRRQFLQTHLSRVLLNDLQHCAWREMLAPLQFEAGDPNEPCNGLETGRHLRWWERTGKEVDRVAAAKTGFRPCPHSGTQNRCSL